MFQVIDPSIIRTLAFGLLPIPQLAVNVRILAHTFSANCDKFKVSFGVGLCPDLSDGVDRSVGISTGSAVTKAFVWYELFFLCILCSKFATHS
jgi:hypothetical protein